MGFFTGSAFTNASFDLTDEQLAAAKANFGAAALAARTATAETAAAAVPMTVDEETSIKLLWSALRGRGFLNPGDLLLAYYNKVQQPGPDPDFALLAGATKVF